MPSCLKKIDEVDEADKNIFDPTYDGDIWFEVDTIYLFTDQWNNEKVKFNYHILEERTPLLKPSQINLWIAVNDNNGFFAPAPLSTAGLYGGTFTQLPDGTTSYCVEIGVVTINGGDTLVYNQFTQCKDL